MSDPDRIIKLFDRFEENDYDKEGKMIKIIYPSIIVKEQQLYYDSAKEVSDILYLFCMRGDLNPMLRANNNFDVELRLNPIIADLFKILFYFKKENGLSSVNFTERGNIYEPKLFIDSINQKMAEKLKLYKRQVFGDKEFETLKLRSRYIYILNLVGNGMIVIFSKVKG